MLQRERTNMHTYIAKIHYRVANWYNRDISNKWVWTDSQCYFNQAAVMTMTATIQQTLRPFFVTCFIIGLGIYPIKQSNSRTWWIVFLSILYSLIVWFIYAYLFYYIITLFTWKVLFRSDIVAFTVEINIFITVISVIMTFYHQKVQ